MIPNQSTSKKTHVSDLSKPDALMDKTQQSPSGTMVPRLGICRSIIPLSKITHVAQSLIQPKKQGNKNKGRGGGCGRRKVGQNLKKGGNR